jgi:hypothetical protein
LERDGFELGFFVEVGRLQNMIRAVEDDESVARDVGLDVSEVSCPE